MQKGDRLLFNINRLLKALNEKQYDLEQSGNKLTVIRTDNSQCLITEEKWNVSPHNGDIEDYQEIKTNLNDQLILSRLNKLYCELKQKYIDKRRLESEIKMLKEIGILEGD